MIKILILSPKPPPVGGIASWTIHILNFLNLNSNEIAVTHQDTGIKHNKFLKRSSFNRIIYGITESYRILKDLKNNIRTHQPNVIHLTSSASLALFKDILILRVARRNKIPVVIHWHFGRIPLIFKKRNWDRRLLVYVMNRSFTSVVLDPGSFKTLINNGIVNTKYIPNPISLKLEARVESFSHYSNIRKGSRLVFVGRIIRNKGIYELLKACAELTIVDKLLLIGPYNEQTHKSLMNIAKTRNNGSWLKFSGTLDNEQVLMQLKE